MDTTKTCKKCNETKGLNEFYKNSKNKDGHDTKCIECEKARVRELVLANPDYYKEKNRRWKSKNHERYLEYMTEWNANNFHKRAASRNRYRAKNYGVLSTVVEADLLHLIDVYGWKCMVCQTEENLSWDHINPMSKGGTDTPDNLQILCVNHNSQKGTKMIDHRPSLNVG